MSKTNNPTKVQPKDFLEKMNIFAAHWAEADAAYGDKIELSGGYGKSELAADRDALSAQMTGVVGAENAHQIASGALALARKAMQQRMIQFNRMVRALLPDSIEAGLLTRVPGLSNGYGPWLKAMQETAFVWAQADASPEGPITLSGGYALGDFEADSADLETKFIATRHANSAWRQEIAERDILWVAIYARLKQYRLAIQGFFEPEHYVFASLPALSPPRGATPDPVEVSAVWDPVLGKAVITFGASEAKTLDRYALRACFGPRYRAADEQAVASLSAVALPRRFETDAGLVAPGDKVFFKVYVVLKTGNEKGSHSVSVVRP